LISPSHGLPSSYTLDLYNEIVAVRSLHPVWQHCQCWHLPIKNPVCWDVMLCHMAEMYQCFGSLPE